MSVSTDSGRTKLYILLAPNLATQYYDFMCIETMHNCALTKKNLVLLVLHAHVFLRTRLVGGKLNEQVRHSRQSRRLYSLTYLIGVIHKLRTQGGGDKY